MSNLGTPAYMLTVKDHPSTSHLAAKTLNTTELESLVFEFVKSKGEYGATAYECINHFNPVSNSSINARPSALERKGFIYYRGDTRKGGTNRHQRVMRAFEGKSNE
tara:strand:+ start:4320 stop:4637 length:318 start_codon:yes stop_codon:yes gene_type:complete